MDDALLLLVALHQPHDAAHQLLHAGGEYPGEELDPLRGRLLKQSDSGRCFIQIVRVYSLIVSCYTRANLLGLVEIFNQSKSFVGGVGNAKRR